MLSSYLTIALANLLKHRWYSLINICGLALAMAIFMIGTLIISYEYNHDSQFSQRDQIHFVSSVFAQESGEGLVEFDVIRSAYGPLFKTDIISLQHVARTIHKRYLVGDEQHSDYVGIAFTDTSFSRIFDFQYLYGDHTAIANPNALIITESTAKRLFGRTDVMGKAVKVERSHAMTVGAVIANLPTDSHFNSPFIPHHDMQAFASIQALVNIDNFDLKGSWTKLGVRDLTYIVLPQNKDIEWLNEQINAVSARHAPAGETQRISHLKAHPLVEANTLIWRAFGLPVLESVQVMTFLVLLIGCVNYTNLATTQSFNRAREVGLRRTFGATPRQLLVQFLLESQVFTALAMLIALAAVELILPVYNQSSQKAVMFDYGQQLLWVVPGTLAIGLVAGAYPAWLITCQDPVDTVHNAFIKTPRGSLLRSLLISTQFAISIFIIAIVMIIYFQNQQVQRSSNIFDKQQTILLSDINLKPVKKHQQTLRKQLLALPGVESLTFSSHVPFDQINHTINVKNIDINSVAVDPDFMSTYKIPLIEGRLLSQNKEVVINPLAAIKLGFGSPKQAIGKTFYSVDQDPTTPGVKYTVVGLMPNLNFLGLFNQIMPMMIYLDTEAYIYASIRISKRNHAQTLLDIDRVWAQVIADYPIKRKTLADIFNGVFGILLGINQVLFLFAVIALLLALVGLFSLAAFMAQNRTKEIGLRKIMGASVLQIVSLLIWQFSRPVMWSLLVAIPLAYMASDIYLNFFQERITFVVPVILLASLVAILSAWAIVAVHAINIARAMPIDSLRYE